MHDKARKRVRQVLHRLQQVGHAWISLGATKTGMVYRLKGNPRRPTSSLRRLAYPIPRSFPMDYATSLEEVLWGITLVAITVALHGCGMLATLVACHAVKQSGGGTVSFLRGGAVLILASWMIVLIHLSELLVWALFFLWKAQCRARAHPTTSR